MSAEPSSSETTSNGSQAQQNAYALAQAGLNDALAILNGQLASDGSVATGGTDPRSASLFSSARTVQYPNLGGSVTYSGTIDTDGRRGFSDAGASATSSPLVRSRRTSAPVVPM